MTMSAYTSEMIHPMLIMIHHHELVNDHIVYYEFTKDGWSYFCCSNCGYATDVYTEQKDDTEGIG